MTLGPFGTPGSALGLTPMALAPLGEREARDGAFISRRGMGEGVPIWMASLFIELFTQAG